MKCPHCHGMATREGSMLLCGVSGCYICERCGWRHGTPTGPDKEIVCSKCLAGGLARSRRRM